MASMHLPMRNVGGGSVVEECSGIVMFPAIKARPLFTPAAGAFRVHKDFAERIGLHEKFHVPGRSVPEKTTRAGQQPLKTITT